MAEIVISDPELVERLREIAASERRSVEAVLRSLIANYEAKAVKPDPLASFRDAVSGKSFDMSKSIRETSENRFRKKYGDSD